MPRKAKPVPEAVDSNMDEDAVRAGLDAAGEEGKRLAEIDTRYGACVPYDKNRLIKETRFYLSQSAEAMLQAGLCLIQLKEHELHGEFIEALAEIDLQARTAQLMMKAAVKFSGSNAKSISHLGRTKLFDLMTEDDEELEALAEGGTLAGHTLDEIDRMSSRELRAALRKAREKASQETETHERMLAAKNEKLDDLDRKLHEAQDRTRPWAKRAFEISMETTRRAAEALQSCDQLDALRDAILTEDFGDEDNDAAIESMAVVYYDAVRQLFDQAEELAAACEEVFSSYRDRARPMLDVEAFRGEDGGSTNGETLQ